MVGLPGERVKIEEGLVYINGVPPGRRAFARPYYEMGYYGQEERVIPQETLTLFWGDNSSNSDDSRFWGYVPRKKHSGTSLASLPWPLQRIRILR